MIKVTKNIILITTFCLISFFSSEQHTLAKDDDHDFESEKPMSIEEVYEAQGYTKGIEEKIGEFEEKFDSVVNLPEKMPFKVSHKFAKIEEDNTLSLHFIGEDQKDIFQITINPNTPFEEDTNYTLDNGKKIYFEVLQPQKMFKAIQLYMKNDKFEYILGMKTNEKYTKETLINVAESIK